VALGDGTASTSPPAAPTSHSITVAAIDPQCSTGQTVTQERRHRQCTTAGEWKRPAAARWFSALSTPIPPARRSVPARAARQRRAAWQRAGALTVNGGIFDLNDHNQTVGSFSGTGGTVDLRSGALTVTQGTAGSLCTARSSARQSDQDRCRTLT